MARRNNRKQRRVTNVNARRQSLHFVDPSRYVVHEDRRAFTPEPYPHPKRFNQGRARIVVHGTATNSVKKSPRSRSFVPGEPTLSRDIKTFQEPKKVLTCVRRKERREVIFAKGKSGGSKRRPKFNERSKVRC